MSTALTEPRQQVYDREFRRLATLSAAGITSAGILLLIIIGYAGWSSNHSAAERERTLLQHALNRGIGRALNEQKSVAWWDDAVLKITDAAIDLDFTDSNFGVFLTETYGHDEVYILNAHNQPLYAFAQGARGEPARFGVRKDALDSLIAQARGAAVPGLKVRPDTFGSDQTNYRTLGGPMQTASWAGHILSVDGRLAVVAALTIVPNVDMSLLKGQPNLLISVTYIDDEYIIALQRSLLLTGLAITQSPALQSGVVSEPFEGDDGVHAGYLSWTTERPGQVLTSIILPLVALGVFAVGFLANGILRRLKQTSQNLAQREQQSRHAARHDDLSGLPNRAHFAERLRDALNDVALLGDDHRAVVAYLDIDHFKDVNDTLGHPAGDELIATVAGRLRSHLREGDFLARYGGDEFAILWMTQEPGAGAIMARHIQRTFAAPFQLDGQSLVVTASAGIAVGPENGSTVDDVMRHADIALYEAKSQGRNRSVQFSEDMAHSVTERRAIELDLRAAFDTEELQLNYQPIVSCATGTILGVEALLRWRHPVRGFISPATFIPIAEQSGLMPALGEWVLARAMKDWHRWPHLQVSVNLSPVQFRQLDLEALLRRLVTEHGVTPSQFVLEITEGVLLESCERTSQTLDAIRDMGFLTALDDFGTGYSSLAYLCNFRFDKIKIDRSFVSGMAKSESYRTIVRAVIALGSGLGMEIVAEGVETEAEAITMTEFGCSELQGYYFSRPIALEPLLSLLEIYQPKIFPATRSQPQTNVPFAVAG